MTLNAHNVTAARYLNLCSRMRHIRSFSKSDLERLAKVLSSDLLLNIAHQCLKEHPGIYRYLLDVEAYGLLLYASETLVLIDSQ